MLVINGIKNIFIYLINLKKIRIFLNFCFILQRSFDFENNFFEQKSLYSSFKLKFVGCCNGKLNSYKSSIEVFGF